MLNPHPQGQLVDLLLLPKICDSPCNVRSITGPLTSHQVVSPSTGSARVGARGSRGAGGGRALHVPLRPLHRAGPSLSGLTRTQQGRQPDRPLPPPPRQGTTLWFAKHFIVSDQTGKVTYKVNYDLVQLSPHICLCILTRSGF